MYRQGVHATSVDEILAASKTGKSQFYHYFSSKEELVAEVLWHHLDRVLVEQRPFALERWDGIAAWLNALVDMQEERGCYRGCPLGSLVAEIADADVDDTLRRHSAAAFARWELTLAEGLRKMKDAGALRPDADPGLLAEATMASVQGGYLLSTAKGRVGPMRNALAAALAFLRSFAEQSGRDSPREP